MIFELGGYDFKNLYHRSLNVFSPLEVALVEESFEVAVLLLSYKAPVRLEVLQTIFAAFMERIPGDSIPAYFMVSHFPEHLIYFKNQEGFDLMQLAIQREFAYLVDTLFEMGYKGDMNDLLSLAKSEVIRELIKERIE